MLNAKALSHLLTSNTHPILYPQWLIITPVGTLIAYSTPASTSLLRHQAALVSSTWTDHDSRVRASQSKNSVAAAETSTSSNAPGLQALTIETPSATIIARPIQARLVLVLVAPKLETSHLPTASHEDAPDEAEAEGANPETTRSEATRTEGRETKATETEDAGKEVEEFVVHAEGMGDERYPGSDGKTVLRMQREKVDKGVVMFREELKKRGFEMPESVD